MKRIFVLLVFVAFPLCAAEQPAESDPRLHSDGKGWKLNQATITDPHRPRVLLIGDSILNGYMAHVIKALEGRAYIDAWVNPYCQSEHLNNTVLPEVLAKGPYDVVHFNMGLHGWQEGRIKPGTFEPLTTAYVKTIQAKLPRAKIIWASSTPVLLEGDEKQLDPVINATIIEHNRMAANVMAACDVPVNDFYSLLANRLDLARGGKDKFHWTPPAYALLGNKCVESITQSLGIAAAPPNIVFIFADDWGWGDLSCHGHPYVKTPNIDRLAKEGTDFCRFTVASGVCSPSRTAVMTGHFPARYNIDGHFAWAPQNQKRNMPDWLNPEATLLPRLLQQAGYATAHFGKWHLSNDMIPDSPLPSVYGYDAYAAFNCAGEQMPVHEDARHAIAFMEQCAERQQPFFINLWIHEPHTPFHTVPKYEWRFRDIQDKADHIYASVLSHADDRIGEVLAAIDRLRLTDNTLVIFSSDNGPARSPRPLPPELMYDTATGAGWGIGASKGITAGRKGYKASLFEGGINVPFIARWPGRIAAGKVETQSLISAVDLLPTFCELAGARLPDGYEPDGVNQAATLQGQAASSRAKPLFWRMEANWPPRKETPDHWVAYVVVHEKWKLLVSPDGSRVELYDLQVDPLEKVDLSQSQPDVIARLRRKIEDWKATLPAHPTGAVFSKERENLKSTD